MIKNALVPFLIWQTMGIIWFFLRYILDAYNIIWSLEVYKEHFFENAYEFVSDIF